MLRISAKEAKRLGLSVPKKKHKYGAVATVVDGINFPSKKEARRYSELKLLEKSGKISDLSLQPVFRIVISGVFVGEYRADFRYTDNVRGPGLEGLAVVEDAKGYKTPLYRFKKRIVEALYGVIILET